jgi:heptosyltransferase-2
LNKILVIQTASIGDVILATPVIEKLHAFFPEANIDFLLKKGNESLFNRHPFLHNVLIWDKSKEKYKNLYRLLKYIRANNYDAIVNIQRFATSGLLTTFSGAKYKIGFNKNPFSIFFTESVKHKIKSGNMHETIRNQRLVVSITNDEFFPVKLYPSKKDAAHMSQYKTAKYITVSPASLWFTKQFPKERWIDFVSKLEKELVVYFLGSKKDYEFCNEIILMSGHRKSMNLAGKLSFLESAELMKSAAMNFMNDSAPMHLASAVNAPTTVIFCSTVTDFGFGPLSTDSIVVEKKEKLDCRPCGLHGHKACPQKHFKCALDIDMNELIARSNS